jgi:hypothetical protein
MTFGSKLKSMLARKL